MIADNISWLLLSKTGYHFILSSIVIISLKPMLLVPTHHSCHSTIIIGNLFELITGNFWILNRVNAVFPDPWLPMDFEFIDDWLRPWNIFVKTGVFCRRYIGSKFLYKSFKFQIIIFFDFSVRCPL